MRILAGVAMAAVVALTATGCASHDDTDEQAGRPKLQMGSEAPDPDDIPDGLLGKWTSDETGDPYLKFVEDGTVTGSDGCNGLSSTWTVRDDRILVDVAVSTKKACRGVDYWVGGVREVALEGDTLRVMNSQGEEIGTLQRQ